MAPGVFRWTYEAPESPASGEAQLAATVAGDPASVATLEVKLRPPRPEPVGVLLLFPHDPEEGGAHGGEARLVPTSEGAEFEIEVPWRTS